MKKKAIKKIKVLRLRTESLKILNTDQQLRVHAGAAPDPWDPPPETAYPVCQVA